MKKMNFTYGLNYNRIQLESQMNAFDCFTKYAYSFLATYILYRNI